VPGRASHRRELAGHGLNLTHVHEVSRVTTKQYQAVVSIGQHDGDAKTTDPLVGLVRGASVQVATSDVRKCGGGARCARTPHADVSALDAFSPASVGRQNRLRMDCKLWYRGNCVVVGRPRWKQPRQRMALEPDSMVQLLGSNWHGWCNVRLDLRSSSVPR